MEKKRLNGCQGLGYYPGIGMVKGYYMTLRATPGDGLKGLQGPGGWRIKHKHLLYA